MCGKGHTGMRGVIIVETQQEFDRWMAGRKPQYLVAHPDLDPALKKAATPAVDSAGAKKDSTIAQLKR